MRGRSRPAPRSTPPGSWYLSPREESKPSVFSWRDPSEDSSSELLGCEPRLTSCLCLPPLAFCRMGAILATASPMTMAHCGMVGSSCTLASDESNCPFSDCPHRGFVNGMSCSRLYLQLLGNNKTLKTTSTKRKMLCRGTESKRCRLWMRDARKWAGLAGASLADGNFRLLMALLGHCCVGRAGS